MGRPKNSKNKYKARDPWTIKQDKVSKMHDNYALDSSTDEYYESSQYENQANPRLLDGTSDAQKKKKVAPRSGLQFKIGPSFENTVHYHQLFLTSTGEEVFPIVNARIDRGFEKSNGEWIGYKRNYFTLVSCFELENKSPSVFFYDKFHIFNDSGVKENISCFALRLISKCSEDSAPVNLIQHTAKRDRGPQYSPPVFPAIPGFLPPHSIIKQASNIRNGDKIDQFNKLFFLDIDSISEYSEDSIFSTYPEGKVSTVARYERIQFSTSINYRKPTAMNRHFVLKVELLGLMDEGKYAVIASTETQPLVVRGRSPSNYQTVKRALKNNVENLPKTNDEKSFYELQAERYPKIDFNDNEDKRQHSKENVNSNSISEHCLFELQEITPKAKRKKGNFTFDRRNRIHIEKTGSFLRPNYNGARYFYDDTNSLTGIESSLENFTEVVDPLGYSHTDINLASPLDVGIIRSESITDLKGSSFDPLCANREDISNTSTANNSSFNLLEDSFVEFQREMSILQKELKSDYNNENNILVL